MAEIDLGGVGAAAPATCADLAGSAHCVHCRPASGQERCVPARRYSHPERATATDLERLGELIAAHDLSRIVLLGDFLHAAAGARQPAPHYASVFVQWRAAHPQVDFIVVAGNHARRAAGANWSMSCNGRRKDGARGPLPVDIIRRHRPGSFVLSGHPHPAIRLRGSRRERTRVPVCWVRRACAVLPSFGSFTGSSDIEPQPQDELFAFAADRVWRLPRQACADEL